MSRSTVLIEKVRRSSTGLETGGQDSTSLGDGGSGGCVVLVAKQSGLVTQIQISGSDAADATVAMGRVSAYPRGLL